MRRRRASAATCLVAHERAVLERMAQVHSKCVSSTVEGDRVAIHWNFEMTDKAGKTRRFDEVALQEWRGEQDLSRALLLRSLHHQRADTPSADTSIGIEAM